MPTETKQDQPLAKMSEPARSAFDVSTMLAARGRLRSRSKFCLLLMWSLIVAWLPFASAIPGTLGYTLSRLLPWGIVVSMVAGVILRYRAGALESPLAQAIGLVKDVPPLMPGDYISGFWVTDSENRIRLDRDGGVLAVLRIHAFVGVWVAFAILFAVVVLASGTSTDRLYAVPFLVVASFGTASIVRPKVVSIEINYGATSTLAIRRVVLGCIPKWTRGLEIRGFNQRPDLSVELRLGDGSSHRLCGAAISSSTTWDALRILRTLQEFGLTEIPTDLDDVDDSDEPE